MPEQIVLGEVKLEVVKKEIKNIHLSVHPPNGRVVMAAPHHMKAATLRVFAISKLDWIKRQQKRFRDQPRETPRDYIDRESHYVWGKRYLLKLVEREAAPGIELKHSTLVLSTRPGTEKVQRQALLERWYRDRIRELAMPLIRKWEKTLGVRSNRLLVQRMRTKWGSCNPRSRNIRINTELAKKPPECLEYIVVHELLHLLEPSHNARFQGLMNRYLPHWKTLREELNRAPLAHEKWEY